MRGEGERTHDPAGDGVLDWSARARELGERIVEMFSAADEYDPARLDGSAEPVSAQGLFRKVETLHRIGLIHCLLVLSVDNAAGNDAAGLVGQKQRQPRIREVCLPLIQNPACGTQNGAVRVDLPDDSGSGPGIDARRGRAAPALLDLLGDKRRRNGSPKQALRDQPFAGSPYFVLAR